MLIPQKYAITFLGLIEIANGLLFSTWRWNV